MQQIILMIHVLVSMALIALVLLQHGKGADVGAAFGSGASQTIFGARGSSSFLVKVTSGLAAVFFITSLTLGYLAATGVKQIKKEEGLLLPTTSITAPVSPLTNPVEKEPNKLEKVKK